MSLQVFLDYLIVFISAAGATFGCSIVFNTAKKDLLFSSLIGGIGWGVFKIVSNYSSSAVAYFCGSFVVATLSEVFGIALRKPATVYLLPGLLPFVPGGGMFKTMEAAVSGEMEQSFSIGFETLTAAGAIAFGIALSTSIAGIIHRLISSKL